MPMSKDRVILLSLTWKEPILQNTSRVQETSQSLGTVGSQHGLDRWADNLGRELQGCGQGTPRGTSPGKQIDRSSF